MGEDSVLNEAGDFNNDISTSVGEVEDRNKKKEKEKKKKKSKHGSAHELPMDSTDSLKLSDRDKKRKRGTEKSNDGDKKKTDEGHDDDTIDGEHSNDRDKKKRKKKHDVNDDVESSDKKRKKRKSHNDVNGDNVKIGADKTQAVKESREDGSNNASEGDQKKKKKKKEEKKVKHNEDEKLSRKAKKKDNKVHFDGEVNNKLDDAASNKTQGENEENVTDLKKNEKAKKKKKKTKGHDDVNGNNVEIEADKNEVIKESLEDVSNKATDENRRKEKEKKVKHNKDEKLSGKAKKKDKKVRFAGEVNNEVDGAAANKIQGENEENVKKKEKVKKKKKKVSFTDQEEVFYLSDNSGEPKNIEKKGGIVHAKRFSPEEDELIREAVDNFIESRGLGDDGVNMVLKCSAHPEIRHCWKEISSSLPWRPSSSVYSRAHVLFQRKEERKWTPEEIKVIHDFYEKNGPDWKTLAEALGAHRLHIKEVWRRTKLQNRKYGNWSQSEYKKLFDLVNMDLRKRALEEKMSKHGMLRDNISWGAISDKLETRVDAHCCAKWYYQLASPMVSKGIWADVDDHRLLIELREIDAACIEDVDWDSLLEHRSGELCRKRWDQMVRHLGEHGQKSFAEQVEILYDRYNPEVLEAREIYDSKTAIDL